MKRASCPAACVILAFVLTIFTISCGGSSDDTPTPEIVKYLVTDLEGTWYLNTVNVNNTGDAGDSYYGQMVVTSGGNIVSGEYFNYPTGVLFFTVGTLALTPEAGIPSGRINTDSLLSFILDSGKMDPSRYAMVFNNHKSIFTTEFDLTVAFKRGGSYTNSNLIGTWYLFGLCSGPVRVGAVRGYMVIGNSGGITGSYLLGGGIAHAIADGAVSFISGTEPVFIGSFVTGDAVTRSIVNGIMDNSKTFASFNAIVSSDGGATVRESEIVVMIKEASGLSNADLAGTWYIAGASAGNIDPADDGAITGNLTMSASGAITGGTLNLPGAAASSITGGNMTVNASGALAGTITAGADSIVFTNGRLDASKKKMAFTDINTTTSPNEEKRLFILFK